MSDWPQGSNVVLRGDELGELPHCYNPLPRCSQPRQDRPHPARAAPSGALLPQMSSWLVTSREQLCGIITNSDQDSTEPWPCTSQIRNAPPKRHGRWWTAMRQARLDLLRKDDHRQRSLVPTYPPGPGRQAWAFTLCSTRIAPRALLPIHPHQRSPLLLIRTPNQRLLLLPRS